MNTDCDGARTALTGSPLEPGVPSSPLGPTGPCNPGTPLDPYTQHNSVHLPIHFDPEGDTSYIDHQI